MHIISVRKYSYEFIADLPVPSRLFRSMHNVQRLSEEFDRLMLESGGLFSKMKEIASVESVKGSNAIEGIGTTDERARGIVLHDTKPVGHDEEALAGYRDALELIHGSGEYLPFDPVTICGLHRTMYAHMGGGGAFKETDNVIVDHTPQGNRVRWEPVSAAETEANIDSMVLAYKEACGNPEIEPLVLIPCVILDFLCIHPFTDGNGRVSRLLTDLLLYRHGFSIQRFVSLEAAINSTKDRYYAALAESSAGWHGNENDYVPFVEYFVEVMDACTREFDRRRISVTGTKSNKTERIEAVVMESLVPISKREICDLLLDVSPTTVESVLSRMMKEGKIIKIGTTRSARYRRA